MNTTIQKWGNSQGIRIPKIILEDLGIKENDKLDLSVDGERIIIKKVKKRKTIKELFENYTDEYVPEEIDWGKPEGKEIW